MLETILFAVLVSLLVTEFVLVLELRRAREEVRRIRGMLPQWAGAVMVLQALTVAALLLTRDRKSTSFEA
jgi:hypothetical protein